MNRRRFDDEAQEESALPWLEPVEVEEEPGETYVSRNLLIGMVALFLLLLGGGIYFLYDYFGPNGDYSDRIVPLVRAPAEPYRVPAGPAGNVQIDGEGEQSFDVAAGLEPSSPIDLDAVPEAPLPRAQLSAEGGDVAILNPPVPAPAATAAASAAAPKNILPPAPKVEPKPAPKPVVKAAPVPASAPKPAPVVTGGGLGLQLGAFSSGAKADAAWKQFTSRYSYLAPLQKQLQPLARDGKTLYRLVAKGVASKAEADQICAKLRVAGESCMVVQ